MFNRKAAMIGIARAFAAVAAFPLLSLAEGFRGRVVGVSDFFLHAQTREFARDGME